MARTASKKISVSDLALLVDYAIRLAYSEQRRSAKFDNSEARVELLVIIIEFEKLLDFYPRNFDEKKTFIRDVNSIKIKFEDFLTKSLDDSDWAKMRNRIRGLRRDKYNNAAYFFKRYDEYLAYIEAIEKRKNSMFNDDDTPQGGRKR